MKHKTDFPEKGYKTKIQWAKQGKIVKEGVEGIELWTNYYHQQYAVYYLPEEVQDGTKEELQEVLKESKRKERIRAKKRYQEKKKYIYDLEKENNELRNKNYQLRKDFLQLREMINKEIIAEVGKYNKTIVFDVETTGLDSVYDEIIQISVINDKEEVLINTYVKPYVMESWEEAQEINGISPKMVENSPYPHEIIAKVKSLFENASIIIAYNAAFDISFLERWGINFSGKTIMDVMLDFAPIYGEWSEYFGDYKWQKLITCAGYYGYQFNAHDSLEDVKATLYCYKKMQEKNCYPELYDEEMGDMSDI